MESLKEKLKLEIKNQIAFILACKKDFHLKRKERHDFENILASKKYDENKSYNKWVLERKKLKTLKGRLSSMDWRARKYTKQHFGEVLAKMEGA